MLSASNASFVACSGGRYFVRSIKTIATPVYTSKEDVAATTRQLMSSIELLDDVLNRSSQDKTILWQQKYKQSPSMLSAKDHTRMQKLLRAFTGRLQLEEAYDLVKQRNPESKLGKIGLQLFLHCHENSINSTATSLARKLLEHYIRDPQLGTISAIEIYLKQVREFLKLNKITLSGKDAIDSLVKQITHTDRDSELIRKVLEACQYKFYSDDIARVVRGRRTFDEIEVSKGWKLPFGIMGTNDAYLRSLDLPKNKLVSVNEECLVLVYDGTLREANKILPSIHHANSLDKPLLVLVSGDCASDALVSVTISNNKNKRNGKKSRVILMKYMASDNDGLELQENHDLVEFLRLPAGFASIYSPDYSTYVPSKVCAKEYFGRIESLKATTGEAFLYNSDSHFPADSKSKFIKNTVTVYVGGQSELEIDQRRNFIDHLLNNELCHGLSNGFVPAKGVALVKAIPKLLENVMQKPLNERVSLEAIADSLVVPMETSLLNGYCLNNFQVSTLIGNTIANPDFTLAQLTTQPSHMINTVESGILEPWDTVDRILANTILFIKLLTSCDTIVSRIFERPTKRST